MSTAPKPPDPLADKPETHSPLPPPTGTGDMPLPGRTFDGVPPPPASALPFDPPEIPPPPPPPPDCDLPVPGGG